MAGKIEQYSPLGALIIGCTALVVSLRPGGGISSSSPESTFERVTSTGVIEACTVINPPTTIKDASSGRLSGHMVDTMLEIAKRIQAKVDWHESTWGNAAVDLQSRRCDVVVAPFFANVTRAQAVSFTQPPLFYMGHSALVRKDDSRFTGLREVKELDRSDLTIVVATGEVGDIYVRHNFSRANIRRIDVEASDLSRFALEVSSGTADAAISGSDVARLYAKKHPEVIDLFKNRPFGLTPVGWAVRHNDIAWLRFLETALIFLESQGKLKEFEMRYDAAWLRQERGFSIE